MSIFRKIKAFYKKSAENKIQTHLFLGFVIIPVVAMTLLYCWVILFWL